VKKHLKELLSSANSKYGKPIHIGHFLIATVHGSTGGYSPTKSPEQINLYDMITIMEREIQFRQQPVPETDNLQEFIALNSVYEHLENNME